VQHLLLHDGVGSFGRCCFVALSRMVQLSAISWRHVLEGLPQEQIFESACMPRAPMPKKRCSCSNFIWLLCVGTGRHFYLPLHSACLHTICCSLFDPLSRPPFLQADMAKSKNHTNHNQNFKAHRNGIKRPSLGTKISTKGVSFLSLSNPLLPTPSSQHRIHLYLYAMSNEQVHIFTVARHDFLSENPLRCIEFTRNRWTGKMEAGRQGGTLKQQCARVSRTEKASEREG